MLAQVVLAFLYLSSSESRTWAVRLVAVLFCELKLLEKNQGQGNKRFSSSSVCQKGLGKGWVTTAAQEMGSSGQLEIQEVKQICRSIRKVDKASLRPQTQLAV